MEYDFIKIEEHSTLAECQIDALSDVNNHLIETESCIQRILKIKNIKIENTTRTKLLSLLDYLNKIIITPNSSRSFSYQYFFYYREILIRMNDIKFQFQFPAFTNEVMPSLKSLFEKIIRFLSQPHKKNGDKKKLANRNQSLTDDHVNTKINYLNDIFEPIIKLEDNHLEFAKAQKTLHDIPAIIKNTFAELNKDPSIFLMDYTIILESVDECIDEINLSNQAIQLFHQTTNLIVSLKSMEDMKCDVQSEEDNRNENSSNEAGEGNESSNENQNSPFQKMPPQKDDQAYNINSNSGNSSLFSMQTPQHTPERRKSIHTNLVTIIEDNDKKIQQLQQNLSNEVRKTEEAMEEINKLRHHYRKKVKKLKEQIVELTESNNQNQSQEEFKELKEKFSKLEKENEKLTKDNLDLTNTINELTDENDLYIKEIEKKDQEQSEQQINSELVAQLNETINIQEIEIQDLDKTNKKFKETIDKLIKENDDIRQENEDFRANLSIFEKKEQLLGKQITLLANQNSKATQEIQKVLLNQEKRLNKFSETISSQIITNPDEEIKKQLHEFNQIKKVLSERKIYTLGDIDNLLNEYDRLKDDSARSTK